MPDIFDLYTIPLDDWIETSIDFIVANYRWLFEAVEWPVNQVLRGMTDLFLWVPPIVMVLIFFLIAWRIAGWKVGVFTLVGLAFLGFLDIWSETMRTLAMVISAVLFCAIVGVPLGILTARSDRIESFMRPFLDVMQTTPSFVYLVPVAMLIGIGPVAGVIATIIFALPPIVRLTNLGIRQVQEEVVEAAFAFGATPMQVLLEIQIPLALRTIMAGLNQTLMLALSMVVIASIIGAGGLGDNVRRGINNVQPGVGFVGGIGIVVTAIILDRVTQAMARPGGPPGSGWSIRRLMTKLKKPVSRETQEIEPLESISAR